MKSIDKQQISKLISKLRKQRDLTRDEMGILLHVSGRTIRRWENGEALPSMEEIVHISNEFNISLEEIYEGELNTDKEFNRKISEVGHGIETINNEITILRQDVDSIRRHNNDEETDSSFSIIKLLLIIIGIMALISMLLCLRDSI